MKTKKELKAKIAAQTKARIQRKATAEVKRLAWFAEFAGSALTAAEWSELAASATTPAEKQNVLRMQTESQKNK